LYSEERGEGEKRKVQGKQPDKQSKHTLMHPLMVVTRAHFSLEHATRWRFTVHEAHVAGVFTTLVFHN
jgi:hypothetical protein